MVAKQTTPKSPMQAQGLLTEIRIGARMAHCRVRSQGCLRTPERPAFLDTSRFEWEASEDDRHMIRRRNNHAVGDVVGRRMVG